MNREASVPVVVIGGIDTHKDIHVAAVVDDHGTVLGTEQYSTTRAGHRALLRWLRSSAIWPGSGSRPTNPSSQIYNRRERGAGCS